MKRILIISEQDLAVVRLIELYNSLFGNEEKALFHCKIDILSCEQIMNNQPPATLQVQTVASNQPQHSRSLPLMMSYTKPVKILVANNCIDIAKIIAKHKINVVLIPNFLYDNNRKVQYDKIVKEIRKVSSVDILGLYI